MEDNSPIISQSDANKLFTQPQPSINNEPSIPEDYPQSSDKSKWKSILFWVAVVVFAFIFGFIIVNGPALFKKVSYWISTIGGKKIGSDQIFQPTVTVSDTAKTATNETLPNDRLLIPSISVDAPVIWEVEESQINDKLLQGVVHYKGTALPSQDAGNVFITGHSSNYWWIKSNFNQVFALLPQLKVGDKVALTYKNNKYVYEVYDKFVVNPDQIDVLKTIDNMSTLTLMSCVPIGTNFQRLIIRSKLLYADQTVKNSQADKTDSANPASNPSASQPNVEKPVEVKPSTTSPSTPTEQPQAPPSSPLLPSVP